MKRTHVPILFLAVSLVLGDWIHRRLDLRRLRLGVLSLLLVAGGMLML